MSLARRLGLASLLCNSLACSDSGASDDEIGGDTSDPGPDPAQPFGSHAFAYAPGSVLPSRPADELDAATRAFYDVWKARYLKAGCGSGRYYVAANTEPGNLTVSEAHGYGMLIAAIMAGHDPDAKVIFDGLYRYFRDHPSAASPDLMAWYQASSCADDQGQDSASDGDLDIAFALLLADKQWGSCAGIDYRGAALEVIAAIGDHELDESHGYVLLGDWATADDPDGYHDATRSSDLLSDHFHSFALASGDPAWTDLRDSTYTLIAALQTNAAPNTGLLPDFIVSPLVAPMPAPADFLEDVSDGSYAYNACRDPWRIATDFLVAGDPRAQAAALAMTNWIAESTSGDPNQIRAGYQLDGSPSPDSDYLTMAFVAPFGPAAMVSDGHQAWLDAIWQTTLEAEPEGYYEDTLKLLTMIVMSGNWWAPEAAADVCSP